VSAEKSKSRTEKLDEPRARIVLQGLKEGAEIRLVQVLHEERHAAPVARRDGVGDGIDEGRG
jgi:hypothetical protein